MTLSSILSFFSGSEEVPPLGFPSPPEINFNSTNIYPTSSTCAVQLTLPTMYHSDYYKSFKNAMEIGFLCHGGFGLFKAVIILCMYVCTIHHLIFNVQGVIKHCYKKNVHGKV